jgi:uncharacterized protein
MLTTSSAKTDTTWIETFTGKKFYPFSPNPDDVDIQDIAHSLSNQCRFNGHTLRFYSVAEHCVHIASYLERHNAPFQICLAGLLHDAAEAYLGDVVRPVKQLLPDFTQAENTLQALIYMKYGITAYNTDATTILDNRILRDEHQQVMVKSNNQWTTDYYQPLGIQIIGYTPEYAEKVFLFYFDRYCSK